MCWKGNNNVLTALRKDIYPAIEKGELCCYLKIRQIPWTLTAYMYTKTAIDIKFVHLFTKCNYPVQTININTIFIHS